MPRGRWMLRIIRKGTRRRMSVSLVEHEEEVDGSKENEESVVRLYREDVGESVFKDE